MRAMFVVLLVAVSGGCAVDRPESAISIEAADLVLGPARPQNVGVHATRVELPDRWSAFRRKIATEGWYRMQVELAPGDEPLGILVTRARLNAEVFFNGTSLGRIGRFEPPIARSQSHAHYYRVPQVLVREGRNEIEIHLATTRGFPGSLHPVWVGPEEDLLPVYQRDYFLNAQGPRAGVFFAWLMALVLFGESITTRAARLPSVLLGASALAMALSGTGYYVTEIPLPSRSWEWLAGCLGHWAIFLLVLSTHRYLGLSRPRLERALLAAFLSASVIFGAVPDLWSFAVWSSWRVATLGLYAYLLVLLVQGVRRAELHPAVPIVAFLVFAPWTGFAATGMMLAAAAGCWILLGRTYRRMQESEALNRELTVRVGAREREVRESYDRLRDLEQSRAVARERERLMRDMHDGTGGQIVSALAMARIPGAERPDIAGVLQEALDDLRLTIESLDPAARDVPSVLGMMREKLERRLVPTETRLVWQVGDAGATTSLDSESALHLIRIVQEAVTNAIKHARASELTIRTASGTNGEVVVEIRDDGSAVAGTPTRPTGRGLGNMRARAGSMGGRLVVESRGEGTAVTLTFTPGSSQSSERTIPSWSAS